VFAVKSQIQTLSAMTTILTKAIIVYSDAGNLSHKEVSSMYEYQ
jgi:hypothetical protein